MKAFKSKKPFEEFRYSSQRRKSEVETNKAKITKENFNVLQDAKTKLGSSSDDEKFITQSAC